MVGRSEGRGSGGVLALLVVITAVLGAGIVAPAEAVSTSEPFTDVDLDIGAIEQARGSLPGDGQIRPDEYRSLALNRAAMQSVLAGVPVEADVVGAEGGRSADLAVIELPAPDGTAATFEVWQSQVMAPGLAAKFPEITTYAGQGVDDPAATIVFDLTPQGFHGQVLSPNGAWYIDPAVRFDDEFHLSYYRDDYTENPHGEFIELDPDTFEPLDESEAVAQPDAEPGATPILSRSGSQLRTHRIAVAANETYTDFHGGTVQLAQAAIVTAINRVTGIYEREVAVSFELVANNDELVFTGDGGACTTGPTTNIENITSGVVTTDAPHGLVAGDVVQIAGNPDPDDDGTWWVFDAPTPRTFRVVGNPSGATAVEWDPTVGETCDPFNNEARDLNVNQPVVDQIVGDANYDVGHVFTTGSGGVAGLGVVGQSGLKARGTTGLPQPNNDRFHVDYVAHELGHQYDGSHTFNGAQGNCAGGNRSGNHAYEPGSGSTIQAYASICGLDDLQRPGGAAAGDGTNASGPYFHSESYDQIRAFTTGGSSGDIGATPSGNGVPTIDAGSDVTVPAQTPFFLNASGSDPDGDTLTYNFEQRDLGEQRALDDPQVTEGPLFRSHLPTTDTTSFFPLLNDIAAGNTNQNATCPDLSFASTTPADCWAQFLVQTSGSGSIPTGNTRRLDFRATVRDNNALAGGVDTDDTVVDVYNTGTPFALAVPNGGQSLSASTSVTWNVAGSASSPVAAATVSVRMSTNGGASFPFELLADTPNDGVAQVPLRNTDSSTVRLMIHSGDYDTGRGFFDMSDDDLAVSAFDPSVTVEQAAGQQDPTTDDTILFTATFNDDVTGFESSDVIIGGTAGATSATVTGSGSTYQIAVSGMTDDGTVSASIPAGVATGSGRPNQASTSDDNVVTWRPSIAAVISLSPRRLLDTRAVGGETVDGRFEGSGRVGAGGVIELDVLGRSGTGVPVSGVGSVVLNTTMVRPEGNGFVTVYPCGSRPLASSLNAPVNGGVVANELVAKVSAAGTVCLYSSVLTDLVADVTGFVPSSSGLVSLSPRRLLDTRAVGGETVDGRFEGSGRVGAGGVIELDVLGRSGTGVPVSGVGSVVLNTTMVRPEGNGFVTVYPCGSRPLASSLNAPVNGGVVANELVAKVSAAGTVCLYSSVLTDLVADVTGYLPATSDFASLEPARLLDTRSAGETADGRFEKTGRLGPGTQIVLDVLDRGGVPGSGVASVVLNATMIRPDGNGFVTVYPCEALPLASSLNAPAGGGVVANEVIAKVSDAGTVCLYTSVPTDLAADVTGYIAS